MLDHFFSNTLLCNAVSGCNFGHGFLTLSVVSVFTFFRLSTLDVKKSLVMSGTGTSLLYNLCLLVHLVDSDYRLFCFHPLRSAAVSQLMVVGPRCLWLIGLTEICLFSGMPYAGFRTEGFGFTSNITNVISSDD